MRCTKCHGIIPEGARECPECGNAYAEIRASKGLFVSIKIEKVEYIYNCPEHGRVLITSTVDTPPIRCPFCK